MKWSGELTNVYRGPATHLQLHILIGYRLARPGDALYAGFAAESAKLAANTVGFAASAYHESRSRWAVSAG
jgi:hypothetical protein